MSDGSQRSDPRKEDQPGSPSSPAAEHRLALQLAEALGQGHGIPEIAKLEGDASTRAYFRARYPDGTTLVLMRYPEGAVQDLATFLDVHAFLSDKGLPVPHIHRVLADQGLVVLEDLGDILLETVAHSEGSGRVEQLYREAVDVLLAMRRATRSLQSGCVAFTLAFDMEKLMYEMDFFMSHFVCGLCKAEPSRAASATLEEFFTHICSLLASEPRVFTHRDYHSRNLMVLSDRLVMIDFQDARMGPAQYDLASLLRDSYVTLSERLVDSLIDRYWSGVEDTQKESSDRFRYVFDMMSLQRNIKALGTFGYQLSVRGLRRYASSIPRTGTYVAANIVKYEELTRYREVIEELVCGPAHHMGFGPE